MADFHRPYRSGRTPSSEPDHHSSPNSRGFYFPSAFPNENGYCFSTSAAAAPKSGGGALPGAGDRRIEIYTTTAPPPLPLPPRLALPPPPGRREGGGSGGGGGGGGGAGGSGSMWCFSDPEMKRRRRVASYKAYSVEGKVKASLRRGLRWFKDKCSEIFHGCGTGWWSMAVGTVAQRKRSRAEQPDLLGPSPPLHLTGDDGGFSHDIILGHKALLVLLVAT
ncbi:hypothetical protein GUJ93_ZPchr0005g15568 [Zizania palustris]|uniref:Uncharacterized protein n=1 Tax=Zizania palustris TaxID=103762 RepID=A0A8J5SL32_ZIZPA|nr:hypothetical protein GUJ93_ZPchr0005g15568 [Zizania palustris]